MQKEDNIHFGKHYRNGVCNKTKTFLLSLRVPVKGFLKHCILAWILEHQTEKMQENMSSKSSKSSEGENLQRKKKDYGSSVWRVRTEKKIEILHHFKDCYKFFLLTLLYSGQILENTS